MSRSFATLNPNALGPSLELEQGGLVLTSNAPDSDIHRCARGTIACRTGSMFYEAVFYGDEDLLDHVSVGIVTATHSLQKYVGELSTGFGFKVGNGNIFTNNASVVTLPAADKAVYIGVLVSHSTDKMYIYINGSLNAEISITTATSWYPAVTVSGLAYKLRCYVNFGQYRFVYPPARSTIGWYTDSRDPPALYFCPRECKAFITMPDDEITNTVYLPRVLNAEGWQFAKRATVWPWEGSNQGGSYAEVLIDNEDHAYDSLLSQDRRDQPFQCRAVNAGGTYNDSEIVATAVIDSIDPVDGDERSLKVTIKDRMTTLEKALQQSPFPPFMDAGVAWRPWPITLGACRNVEPTLFDSVDRRYAIHDAPITNITSVRDMAARLDPYSSPPQYVPLDSLKGIQLQTLPVGLLTSDVSSQGQQVLIPGAVDIFNGAGDFSTWPTTPGPPTNWTATIGGSGAITRLGAGAPYIAQMTTTHAYNPNGGQFGARLSFDSVLLQPGKTYRIQFELVRTQGNTPQTAGGMSYGLMIRSDLTTAANGAITPSFQPLQAPTFGTIGEKYTFVYTCPQGAARRVYFIATASTLANGNGNGQGLVQFNQIKIELLGEVEQILPLEGITLVDYMTEIFQNRGGLTSNDWVDTDCKAIDDATGYRFGVHIDTPMTVIAAARLPLDSFCATQFTDAEGKIRTRRLIDPSTADDSEIVAEFDMTNVKYGVTPRIDLARGLTTKIGVRKNWHRFNDSDFVTDELEVPAALRRAFKDEYQYVQTTAQTPSPTYRFSDQAPVLRSMLDDPEQGQVEIDRVFKPYSTNRTRSDLARRDAAGLPRFYEFFASYDTLTFALNFGDIIRLTYPTFGLQNGQKLAVVGTTSMPFNKQIKIVAWGTE